MMGTSLVSSVLVTLLLAVESRVISIVDHGAVADVATAEVAVANGHALWKSMTKAWPGDEVLVPAGACWYIVPHKRLLNIRDVSLRIDGALVGFDEPSVWPHGSNKYMALIEVYNSTKLKIHGKGAIDGQGHVWWWRFALGLLDYSRPFLLEIANCEDVELLDIALLDAPRFNVHFGEYTKRATIRGLTILVDWEAQQRVLQTRSSTDANLPMFPFNTDGIDVAGEDIVIEDCVISNWDDVIAIKPSSKTRGCTRNVTVSNLLVYNGVGLSIGSVHPSFDEACVLDTKFKNVSLYSPLKGIYIKPDLGDKDCDNSTLVAANGLECSAVVANVEYTDIDMYQGLKPDGWDKLVAAARSRAYPLGSPRLKVHHTNSPNKLALTREVDLAQGEQYSCRSHDFFCFMWPVYIGTQQQLEPDGSGSGIWTRTEPRVTVVNITMTRVKSRHGEWPMSAGVIRCNESNPCTGIVLDDVVIDADLFTGGSKWVCDRNGAFGVVHDKVVPDAKHCLNDEEEEEEAPVPFAPTA